MASTANVNNDQLTQNTLYVEQATNPAEVVSSATVTINTDLYGAAHVTALAVATTLSTSGTQTNDLQPLVVRIKDNGTTRALTWDASFEAVGAALPSATTAGKRHTVRFLYDSTTGKFGSVSAVVEA